MKRFFEKVKKTSTCWLWTAGLHNGYGTFKLNNKQYRVHRLIWEFVNGPVPKDLYVLHKCDIRNCVNPKHLFLGTAQDNIDDCIKKGRFRVSSGRNHGTKTMPERIARGSRHGVSKLDEKDIVNIRKYYASGNETHLSLAKKFKVTEGNIQQIVNRKTWIHV